MTSFSFAETAFADLTNGLALMERHPVAKKVTIFGSARTPQDHPLSLLAAEVARALVTQGWMVITGAGPGIMEAASRGAGREATIGVNIELPFEHGTNPYVDLDTNHVAMTHFFTRKVVMTRSSQAFIALPGGVGTMDEIFEVLTLLYTGKTDPAPVLLLDTPGDTFWARWSSFMQESIIDEGYLSPGDAVAYVHCQSVGAAMAEVSRFYRNYVSYEWRDAVATLHLRRGPSDVQADELRTLVDELVVTNGEAPRIQFSFEGRSYAQLRRVIDLANTWDN